MYMQLITKCPRVLALPTTSIQLEFSRNALFTHYTTKKKRLMKYNRSPDNREWTETLFEGMKAIEDQTKGSGKEPHMLHVVTLVKPTRGRPWWEKDIISELNLEGKLNQPVILKNVPNVNKMLTEVKHLVQIQPLKFPHGLPQHPSDLEHVILKSNGEMIFRKSIGSDKDVATNLDSDGDINKVDNVNKWMLTKETVQKTLDRTIQLHELNKDHFPTKYEYKFNQDGKMYRYNFNKNVRQYKW